jgi:hypothetical protein
VSHPGAPDGRGRQSYASLHALLAQCVPCCAEAAGGPCVRLSLAHTCGSDSSEPEALGSNGLSSLSFPFAKCTCEHSRCTAPPVLEETEQAMVQGGSLVHTARSVCVSAHPEGRK